MNTLRADVSILMDPDQAPGEQLNAAQRLHAQLMAKSGLDLSAQTSDAAIRGSDGVAISPKDAARCLLDYSRTSAYLRGVEAAIIQRLSEVDQVEVYYAGCGPLMPLALLLCHRFDAERVRFWPVDLHETSVAAAQRLMNEFGLQAYFGEIVRGDAAHHRWPLQGDVAVVEVMQRALENEPQVAVTANVAAQLRSDGVLVPELIRLEAQLCDLRTEFSIGTEVIGGPSERVRVPLATLLQLDANSAAAILGGVELRLPKIQRTELTLMISTQIRVAPGIVLGDHDSGVTLPLFVRALRSEDLGAGIVLRYNSGGMPRIEFQVCAGDDR